MYSKEDGSAHPRGAKHVVRETNNIFLSQILPNSSFFLYRKLICNSVYGKLIESVSKRMTCFFDTTREDAIRRASTPLFKGSMICESDLTISFHKRKVAVLSQCHIVGFSVLERSKLVMQKLYYDHILPACNGSDNVSVVMSDTDSFLLSIRNCGDELSILQNLESVMDFSNFPKDHPLFDASKKKKPGFLKSELPDAVIREAVALRSKAYAIRATPLSSVKPIHHIRCKGVAHGAQKKLSLELFKACIHEIKSQEVEQLSIRSRCHKNELVKSLKVCFSSFDDKRHLLCPKHSVPYGSYRLKKKKTGCFLCKKEKRRFAK